MKEELKNSEIFVEHIYQNNGNLLCELEEKYCKPKFK